MNIYLSIYIVGSILGIISELIVSKFKHHCITNPTLKCLINSMFFNLYGWCAVIITYVYIKFNFPLYLYLIISVIIITVMECIGGQISKIIHGGRKTWNYSEDYICACDGYISVVSSIYFLFLILIFTKFVIPIFYKK